MFRYEPSVLDEGLLEEYRRAYEFEIERKDSFADKLSFAFAVVALVVGAVTALVAKMPSPGSGWTIAFNLLLLATYVSLAASLFCLWRAAKHRRYAYLSNIENIDQRVIQMHEANANAPNSYKTAYEFKNFLANRFRDAASTNRENNRIRADWFASTFNSLFLTVTLVIVLIGVTIVCNWRQGDAPQKVEITAGRITAIPPTSVTLAQPLQVQPISITSWPTQLHVYGSAPVTPPAVVQRVKSAK